jgi:hypothetical protein
MAVSEACGVSSDLSVIMKYCADPPVNLCHSHAERQPLGREPSNHR